MKQQQNGDCKLSTDRTRLNGWKYPPSDELYLANKKVYDNPKYFDLQTGAVKYPGTNGDPNIDGFVNGKYEQETLNVGSIIDRYGDNPGGKYFSPDGSSFESRALPPFMKDKDYGRHMVLREFDVKGGKVAPWFGENGDGIQFFTDYKIKDLDGNLVEATIENLVEFKYISKPLQ